MKRGTFCPAFAVLAGKGGERDKVIGVYFTEQAAKKAKEEFKGKNPTSRARVSKSTAYLQ